LLKLNDVVVKKDTHPTASRTGFTSIDYKWFTISFLSNPVNILRKYR